MSSTTLPRPAGPAADLATLRAELDGLDDALHDTLMRRAAVVERIAALRAKGKVPLRPGREAAIIRRLLARHAGSLPRQAIARIWRELLAATTLMQDATTFSVCDAGEGAMAALAREHFGALARVHPHASAEAAMAEVAAGAATAAILPLPAEDDPASFWWTALVAGGDAPRLHVVARLPFWTARPEGAPRARALVLSAAAPDPSGDDRTVLGAETDDPAGLGKALEAAGLPPRAAPLAMAGRILVELDGFLAADDPRLDAIRPLPRRPVVLGAYAVPVEETTP